MALCRDFRLGVTIWHVDEESSPPQAPVKLQDLEFPTLRVDASGNITGDVFINQNGTLIRLSSVTGKCVSLTTPDGNLLSLSFNWGAVDIFLIGYTHPVGPFASFRGRFIALRHEGPIPLDFDQRLSVLAAPGEGSTGTGTGQQT